ncbi:MAG TPA: cyclic nucleotide-binding domain-containing protein [Phnomibacter sp.]|nr:cyclic nucleotide-binding domain-containing protein [Phnomibacter sp.]
MLLVEKVLLLKATDLFAFTNEQDLVDIATILEDVHLDKNTLIFEKGEIGRELYIIYKGSVKVHDGDHTLAVLKDPDFFGELSLLDAEPRSASITTLEDCSFLKLSQEPFFEVLFRSSHVLKGIIKTLCRRVRIQDEKEVKLSRRLKQLS